MWQYNSDLHTSTGATVCVCVMCIHGTGTLVPACENPHSKPGQVADWCRHQSVITSHSNVGPMTSLYIAYELILRPGRFGCTLLVVCDCVWVCVITCKTSIPTGMGSRQFCQGRGRGREVEAEVKQGSNVLNRGEARQRRRQRARGRGEAD